MNLSHPDPADESDTAGPVDGTHPAVPPAVLIAQIPVHLVGMAEALDIIMDSAERHSSEPLGVASINLDHVHHFGGSGSGGAHHRSLLGGVGWLNLIDGVPIASQVHRMTRRRYPKLSGSDLIEPVLDEASRRRLSVGLVGGSADLTPDLRSRFATQWQGISFAGHWTPEREEINSPAESTKLAQAVRAAAPDILLVCLGKPRQEEWIAAHGPETGAGVLLAFGAVVDFLTNRIARAPKWVSSTGLEWLWRLGREPNRLARRYLLQGPPAYIAVRRSRGREIHDA